MTSYSSLNFFILFLVSDTVSFGTGPASDPSTTKRAYAAFLANTEAMKKRKKNSFVSRMAEYAEASSARGLETERMRYRDTEGLYKKRLHAFRAISTCRETKKTIYQGRKVIKLKISGNEVALGTAAGCINTLKIDSLGDTVLSDVLGPGSEHRRPFGAAVQNIFHGDGFVFVSRDGNVLGPFGVCKTQSFVQQSDYHAGLAMLVSTDDENNVSAFDLRASRPIFRNRIGENTSLAIHEDGNVLVYACGSARLVDIRSMQTVCDLGGGVGHALFAGGHVVCTASGNLVQAFDLRTLGCVGNVLSHRDPVCFLQSSGDVLCSGSADGELCVSSPGLSLIHRELRLDALACLAVDGTRFAVCTGKNALRLFE